MCDTQKNIIFGSWNVRGMVQPGRYLLAYCKIPYQEKRYMSPEEWIKDKETIGFDFPNLPYLIHGDKKITESLAIFDYIPIIANKKELLGSDDETRLQMKILSGVLCDVRNEILKLLLGTPKENFNEEKEKSWSQGLLKDKLTRLNKYLGKKEYLCGDITVVDFFLFHLVDILVEMDPAKVSDFPEMVEFHKRFAAIPEIREFRRSEKDSKNWFPPARANWSPSIGL